MKTYNIHITEQLVCKPEFAINCNDLMLHAKNWEFSKQRLIFTGLPEGLWEADVFRQLPGIRTSGADSTLLLELRDETKQFAIDGDHVLVCTVSGWPTVTCTVKDDKKEEA